MDDKTLIDIATLQTELKGIKLSLDGLAQKLEDSTKVTNPRNLAVITLIFMIVIGAWTMFHAHTGDGHPETVLLQMKSLENKILADFKSLEADVKIQEKRIDYTVNFVRDKLQGFEGP